MIKITKYTEKAYKQKFINYYINGKMIGWEQNGDFSGFSNITKYCPKNEKEFIYISIFFKMKLIS